jgi:hypothetical protein
MSAAWIVVMAVFHGLTSEGRHGTPFLGRHRTERQAASRLERRLMGAQPSRSSDSTSPRPRPAVPGMTATRPLGTSGSTGLRQRQAWWEAAGRILGFGLLGVWQLRPAALRRRHAQRRHCAGCRHRHHELLAVLAVLALLQLTGTAVWAVHAVRGAALPTSARSTNRRGRPLHPSRRWRCGAH